MMHLRALDSLVLGESNTICIPSVLKDVVLPSRNPETGRIESHPGCPNSEKLEMRAPTQAPTHKVSTLPLIFQKPTQQGHFAEAEVPLAQTSSS